MAEPKHPSGAPLWAVTAEFDSADAMVDALLRLRGRDLGRLDAFAPLPVPAAAAALRMSRKPMLSFAAGGMLVGAAAMFGMCSYATVWSYRFNIGGRSLFSWPSFVVPSVSFGALLATAVLYAATLLLCRLPRLNHPAFNVPGFTRATADGFFVAVEARDDGFDAGAVEAALAGLEQRPLSVRRVPR